MWTKNCWTNGFWTKWHWTKCYWTKCVWTNSTTPVQGQAIEIISGALVMWPRVMGQRSISAPVYQRSMDRRSLVFLFCFCLFVCFWNQMSKCRVFEKKGYFWRTFHSFESLGKRHKNTFSTNLTIGLHVCCSAYWLFCLTNFAKITNLSVMHGFFFAVTPKYWFFFAPFLSNQWTRK